MIEISVIDADNADGVPVEVTKRQEEKRARREYLKAEDFDVHGYTDGCDGRSRLHSGMDPRPRTETCRTRLEEELAKDNGPRWKNAKAREMARTATDAGLARAREERDKKRRVEEEAEEKESRSNAAGGSNGHAVQTAGPVQTARTAQNQAPARTT